MSDIKAGRVRLPPDGSQTLSMVGDDDDFEYVVRHTYLFLRLSLVGVIIAIFLAILWTPPKYILNGEQVIHSISHYYYTPARIIFVGALCAAALALFALAGRGIQSYLLDIAALLAPLIAILPTPVSLGQVATYSPNCGEGTAECVPKGDFEYMRLGYTVWLCIAGAAIFIAVTRAIYLTVISTKEARKAAQQEKTNYTQELLKRVPWLLIGAVAVSVAVWLFYLIQGQWHQSWFHSKAHFMTAVHS